MDFFESGSKAIELCKAMGYTYWVIRSFRHKALRQLFETGFSRKVAPALHQRILVRLSALDHAVALAELNQPGFNFHALKGEARRYTIHVNGPWTITFEWDEGDAIKVDLEQYH